MKLTDMIVSAILKRGIMYEARLVDVEFDIPRDQYEGLLNADKGIKVRFKAEHMSIHVEKGEAGD